MNSSNVPDASDFDPDTWQPVRLPQKTDSRSSDFPPLDTFVSRELTEMLTWCKKNCRARWHRESLDDGRSVFWFEQSGDAMAFAATWYPFQCL